ncbi:MAG: ribosome maturation factor RimM [Oscillospiraceae bacterium]|nr:ribosome maturation factor RimM [Oscillospiraceae bacterium]
MQKQAYIEAGRVVSTHGVRGEVKIEVWLDSPEYLKSFPRVFLDGRALRLLSGRAQKQFLIAHLEGIDDINAAMPLKGKTVFIAREDAHLAPGAYFIQDIIGARVISETGEEIGTLEEVLERPASDIYLVRDREGAERLIPAVPAFILHVDAEAGTITVRLIEGM